MLFSALRLHGISRHVSFPVEVWSTVGYFHYKTCMKFNTFFAFKNFFAKYNTMVKPQGSGIRVTHEYIRVSLGKPIDSHWYVLACHPYVTRIYSYVISMSLVCIRVTCIYSYVIRMSLVCIRMSSICHLYVFVCHPYVTRMSPVLLVCTCICHLCVTRMYCYIIHMLRVCTCMSPECHPFLAPLFENP